MTELIVYRLNQVPEKKLYQIPGTSRYAAASGQQCQNRSDFLVVRCRCPISPTNEDPVVVPKGTEVASRLTGESEGVIFTTDKELVIVPPKLTQLRRGEDFHKNYLPRLGVEVFYAFNRQKPEIGDTFYLGFDEQRDISGHIPAIIILVRTDSGGRCAARRPALDMGMLDGRWPVAGITS